MPAEPAPGAADRGSVFPVVTERIAILVGCSRGIACLHSRVAAGKPPLRQRILGPRHAALTKYCVNADPVYDQYNTHQEHG